MNSYHFICKSTLNLIFIEEKCFFYKLFKEMIIFMTLPTKNISIK